MSLDLDFLQQNVLFPLTIEEVTATTASPFVNCSEAVGRLHFLVSIGNGDTATVLTLETCTSNSTTGATLVAVPFTYRKSGAAAAYSWGDPTTSANTGVTLSATDDHMSYWIEADPAASTSGYNYYRIYATIASEHGTATVLAMYCFYTPRFAQNSAISAS